MERILRHFAFAIFVILANQAFADDCPPQHVDSISELRLIAPEIAKNAQVNFAKSSPSEFCERNMLLRYVKANPKDSGTTGKDIDGLTLTEIRGLAKTVSDKQAYGQDMWGQSLILLERDQQKVLSRVYRSPDQPYDPFDQAINRKIKESQQPPEVFFDGYKIGSLEEKTSSPAIPGLQASSIAKIKVCSDFNLKETVSCVAALNKLQTIANPRYSGALALVALPAWNQVLASEKKYAEGLRVMSLKLMEKVKAGETGGTNVFDDFKLSFETSGLSKKDAEDATFTMLALYGNGGANLGGRLATISYSLSPARACNEDGSNICAYLGNIAKALPYLDFMRMRQKKKPYSYPTSVEATCNTNKSYHFWLSAYLARELTKTGHAPAAALTATFILGVTYQFSRQVGGINSESQALPYRSAFDPVSNITRADLAYVFSGAAFGSQVSSAKPGSISIDKSLTKLLEASASTLPTDSPTGISAVDQFQKYNTFRAVFNPAALLNSRE